MVEQKVADLLVRFRLPQSGPICWYSIKAIMSGFHPEDVSSILTTNSNSFLIFEKNKWCVEEV